MVKLTKETGEVISFSVKGFVAAAKRTVKRLFKFLHKQLSKLEDKILKAIDNLGKKAEKKIKERTVPEAETGEITL